MKLFTFSFIRTPVDLSKFEITYHISGSSFAEINGVYYDSGYTYTDDSGSNNVIYTNGMFVLVKDIYQNNYSIRDFTLRKRLFISNNMSEDISLCTWTNELGYTNPTVFEVSPTRPMTQIILGENESLFNCFILDDFNYKINASTNDDSEITYRIIDGSLPSDLILYQDGWIRGYTTTEGSYNVTIELRAGVATKTISFKFSTIYRHYINAENTYNVTGNVGDYVNFPLNITVSNGDIPQFYIVNGSLPNGLELTNDGILKGNIQEAGEGYIEIELTYYGVRTEYSTIEWSFENINSSNIPEMVVTGTNSELDGTYFLDE